MPWLRLSTLVIAAALAGCTSLKVNTEYDPTAPFPTYKTYAWNTAAPGPEQAPSIRNPLVRQQVVAAVDREMKAKGLVLASAESNPDLLVSVHGWAQEKIEVTNYGYAYGGAYRYGAYGPGVAYGVPVTDVRQYTEGTLLIDLVDAKAKKLVWRGIAQDTVTSVDAARRIVDEAARQAIGGAYPPKPTK